MGRKVEGPRGPTGQAADSAWKVAAQAETGQWSAARAAGCRRCASCCRFKRIRPGPRILGDVPGTSRSLCPSRGPSEGQAVQSPLPRARGVGTRREQPPRPGRWFRNETHVHEPWPFPRHLRLLLVLVPLRRDPVGKPSPEPRGAGRPRAALVGRRAGRGRGVPTPDAPVRQSGPRPGRGLGRKSRSGEGHMGAPPRPSEGSVCGVGPVARDCPHNVHVCEAAPSVPGTRRPAHLELTCLA